jgi:hypothetical protein
MGRAINKAVTIAEILKRKLPLHQVNHTTSVAMIDSYAPTEEGLDVVSITRYVSCLMITLSLNENHVDVNDIGYQPPLSDSERTGITIFSGNRNQGSGNGRVVVVVADDRLHHHCHGQHHSLHMIYNITRDRGKVGTPI